MTEIQGNLKLLIKTWSRDSHGLFDYETSSTKTNQLLISSSCKLIRKKNDVKFVQENHEIEFEERELAKIFFEENQIRKIQTMPNTLTARTHSKQQHGRP